MYQTRQIDPRIRRMAQQIAAREIAAVKQTAGEQVARIRQRLASAEQQLRAVEQENERLQDAVALHSAEIGALNEQIASLHADAEKKSAEWHDKQLRLHADFNNSKKRIERTHAQRAENVKADLLRDFISVMDNLELALRHEDGAEAQLREGLDATLRHWRQTLERAGVRPIDALNQPFAPDMHEAMTAVAQPDAEPNTVIAIEQTGYTLDDKLLRPARVIVAKA